MLTAPLAGSLYEFQRRRRVSWGPRVEQSLSSVQYCTVRPQCPAGSDIICGWVIAVLVGSSFWCAIVILEDPPTRRPFLAAGACFSPQFLVARSARAVAKRAAGRLQLWLAASG